MMEDVIQRALRLAGVSLLLGLPAAVLAHSAIFGGAHAFGGSSQPWIVLFSGASIGIAAAAAIAGAMLKRTLSLPFSAVIFSTAAWFAAIELREQPHAIPVLQAAALLCLAALIISAAWRGFATAAAGIARELSHRLDILSPEPASQWYKFATPLVAAHAPAYRLFSRPPPA